MAITPTSGKLGLCGCLSWWTSRNIYNGACYPMHTPQRKVYVQSSINIYSQVWRLANSWIRYNYITKVVPARVYVPAFKVRGFGSRLVWMHGVVVHPVTCCVNNVMSPLNVRLHLSYSSLALCIFAFTPRLEGLSTHRWRFSTVFTHGKKKTTWSTICFKMSRNGKRERHWKIFHLYSMSPQLLHVHRAYL